MQDVLRDLQRLASLAGPLEAFLQIRSDGMLSQRLEQISKELQSLWGQMERHIQLTEQVVGTLETNEAMQARLDALDSKLDRLLRLQEPASRSRQ
jgi:cell fate (sporulation/competence/biofilm development) regulator YlbF (YheA/YmcA/DUF963 family)